MLQTKDFQIGYKSWIKNKTYGYATVHKHTYFRPKDTNRLGKQEKENIIP